MKKKSDEEFGILITREMKSMMLDSTITYEQRAKIFCAILPIMCLYPFLQKYFVKGVMIGAVKG